MPPKPTPSKTSEHTFESALERLERIVDEMEGDRMPLDQLLERYGEGTDLLKVCQEKLDAAEKKVELITRSAGKPQLTPFDPAAAEPAGPSTTPHQTASSRKSPEADPADISLF